MFAVVADRLPRSLSTRSSPSMAAISSSAEVIEQQRRPAQGGRCIAHRGDGMAGVVLAVAKGPLAILPRLPPVDRRQAQPEKTPPAKPLLARPRALLHERTALFQTMVAADIVIDAGLKVRQRRQDDIALGGMQVAAAGIAAQGPAVAFEFLPGGQAEGQFEESGNALEVQRPRRDRQGREQIRVGSDQAVRGQRQLNSTWLP